jgi:Glycosyltransferase
VKILQVLPALEGGGVETGTLELARYLVDQGHESWVVSAGGAMKKRLLAEGSYHQDWDLGKKSVMTLRHVFALRRWLREQAFDIVHLRSRMPAWIAWLAWRGLPKQARPRLITTVHGLYSVNRYSKIMCSGERVIVVSDAAHRYVAQNYPDVDPARLVTIPRGIDPDWYYPGYRPSEAWRATFASSFPNCQGKKLLVLPGRLTRLKGQAVFIDLIDHLVNQLDLPVHGLIVGGEDPKRAGYAQELYTAVESRQLTNAITFTGARDDIRDIFSESDLVLSLSTQPESFGRTVLEALSLGRPVVGYDHGGVSDILAELYPSGAVELNDFEGLVDTVAQQLAGSNKPKPNTLFLRQRMLEQTLTTYQELI